LNSGEQLESLLQQAYKNIQNYQKILHLGGEFPLNYFIEFHLTPKGTTVCFARLFVGIIQFCRHSEPALGCRDSVKLAGQRKELEKVHLSSYSKEDNPDFEVVAAVEQGAR
jgi:hypothetical protein